jgi:hypothetical protein
MVAYEFYRGDRKNGHHLIGILPERRKHQERISEESIMKWVKLVIGDNADTSDIFFVKVTFGESEAEKGSPVWREERNEAGGTA